MGLWRAGLGLSPTCQVLRTSCKSTEANSLRDKTYLIDGRPCQSGREHQLQGQLESCRSQKEGSMVSSSMRPQIPSWGKIPDAAQPKPGAPHSGPEMGPLLPMIRSRQLFTQQRPRASSSRHVISPSRAPSTWLRSVDKLLEAVPGLG